MALSRTVSIRVEPDTIFVTVEFNVSNESLERTADAEPNFMPDDSRYCAAKLDLPISACNEKSGMALFRAFTSTRMLSICCCTMVIAGVSPDMNEKIDPGVVRRMSRSPFLRDVREPLSSERAVSDIGSFGVMVMPGRCHDSEFTSALTSMPCVLIL